MCKVYNNILNISNAQKFQTPKQASFEFLMIFLFSFLMSERVREAPNNTKIFTLAINCGLWKAQLPHTGEYIYEQAEINSCSNALVSLRRALVMKEPAV